MSLYIAVIVNTAKTIKEYSSCTGHGHIITKKKILQVNLNKIADFCIVSSSEWHNCISHSFTLMSSCSDKNQYQQYLLYPMICLKEKWKNFFIYEIPHLEMWKSF